MILLDTNVLSELMKREPHARVVAWVHKQSVMELGTTAVTEAETFYGIELLSKGRKREGLLAAAEAMFTEDFAGRVFSFDSEAACNFARIAAHRRALVKPIGHVDAQIAAITRTRGAKLATRNVDDFANCDIDLIDPWRA